MASDYFAPTNSPYPYGYQKQYPVRVISGQNILELGDGQQQTVIGHTTSYCNELEGALNEALSKAEGYYAQLVEAGLIVPPKPPEDIMREQAEQQRAINENILATIQKLSDKIDRMESEKEDNYAEPTANSIANDACVQSTSGGNGGKRAEKLQPRQSRSAKAG